MRSADRLSRFARGLAFAAVCGILIVPILLTIVLSFDARDYLGPLPPHALSLQWYQAFLGSKLYLGALRSSLLIATVAALAATATGVTTALFLHNRRFAGREALLTFFLSPFVIPPIVIGFGLLLTFSLYGIGNPLVRLIAAHTLLTLPFTIRTTLAGLRGVNVSYSEAALTLGAGPSSVFWEVTFPLIRRASSRASSWRGRTRSARCRGASFSPTTTRRRCRSRCSRR